MQRGNVIIFGETGSGKSSIVNMLKGEDVAMISSGASGCTFQSTPYKVDIDGTELQIWDTAGLNEATTVKPADAIYNIYDLMQRLTNGVSLLIYVVRGPRIKQFTVNDYRLFYDAFCKRKVPIVLAITGLEEEEIMDEWWTKNQDVFNNLQMSFDGQACITATKGKAKEGRFPYEEEYEDSREKLSWMIRLHMLPVPWVMEHHQWFISVLKKIWNAFASLFNLPLLPYSQALADVLKQDMGMSEGEATSTANEMVTR